MLAGGKYNADNSAFYLNNNMAYWAGSPGSFLVGYSHVFGLYRPFGLGYADVAHRSYAARGVITLSVDTKLLGSGTYNDVYVVS